MRAVTSCPGCGGVDRHPVCEYNGLVLLEYMRDSPLCRYEYAMCLSCGLVYATRRPEGEELAFLYSRFDEVLGRTEDEQTGGGNTAVDDAERASIQARLARGWLVSEEQGLSDDEWMPHVFEERVLNSFHINLVTALLPITGARILELRATTGYMLQTLRDRWGASEVCAMPMSERHGIVIETLNPMPLALIDFDRLEIPFEGTFDLILARHMVTHALEPSRLWKMCAERLKPGGHVYFFLENDDRGLLNDKRKNLLGEQKAFHFQSFDRPTFARVLRHQGLNPVFIRHPRPGRSEMVCLARRDDTVRGEALSPQDRDERLDYYRRWRDHSVLSLGPELQELWDGEIEDMRRRAAEDGFILLNKGGRIVARKPLRLMHADGYARLNEQRQEA